MEIMETRDAALTLTRVVHSRSHRTLHRSRTLGQAERQPAFTFARSAHSAAGFWGDFEMLKKKTEQCSKKERLAALPLPLPLTLWTFN